MILTVDDFKQLNMVIGNAGNSTSSALLGAGIIKLYLASPDLNKQKKPDPGSFLRKFPRLTNKTWADTSYCGVICLVYDKTTYQLFFQLVSLTKKKTLFQYEVYFNLNYRRLNDEIHCFEIDDCVLGFAFADKDEASKFYEITNTTINQFNYVNLGKKARKSRKPTKKEKMAKVKARKKAEKEKKKNEKRQRKNKGSVASFETFDGATESRSVLSVMSNRESKVKRTTRFKKKNSFSAQRDQIPSNPDVLLSPSRNRRMRKDKRITRHGSGNLFLESERSATNQSSVKNGYVPATPRSYPPQKYDELPQTNTFKLNKVESRGGNAYLNNRSNLAHQSEQFPFQSSSKKKRVTNRSERTNGRGIRTISDVSEERGRAKKNDSLSDLSDSRSRSRGLVDEFPPPPKKFGQYGSGKVAPPTFEDLDGTFNKPVYKTSVMLGAPPPYQKTFNESAPLPKLPTFKAPAPKPVPKAPVPNLAVLKAPVPKPPVNKFFVPPTGGELNLNIDGTIDPSSLSVDMKKMLKAAGVRKADLKSPDMSFEILKRMQEQELMAEYKKNPDYQDVPEEELEKAIENLDEVEKFDCIEQIQEHEHLTSKHDNLERWVNEAAPQVPDRVHRGTSTLLKHNKALDGTEFYAVRQLSANQQIEDPERFAVAAERPLPAIEESLAKFTLDDSGPPPPPRPNTPYIPPRNMQSPKLPKLTFNKEVPNRPPSAAHMSIFMGTNSNIASVQDNINFTIKRVKKRMMLAAERSGKFRVEEPSIKKLRAKIEQRRYELGIDGDSDDESDWTVD